MINEPIVYRVPFPRIAGDQATTFADALRLFASRHPRALIVDMSVVEYIDSECLGTLLGLARRNNREFQCILTNVHAPVITLIRVARLDMVLEIAETVEEALRRLE